MKDRTRLIAIAALLLGVAVSAEAASQKFYPVQSQFGTGWTDGTSKHDGTICWKNGNARRGWAYFDHLDTLYVPFDSVYLYYYQIADTNNSRVTLRWSPINPISASASNLNDSLIVGMQLGNGPGGTGPHYVKLTAPTPWPAVPGTRMCVSFCEDEIPPPQKAGAADGWGTQNQPYIEFFHQ